MHKTKMLQFCTQFKQNRGDIVDLFKLDANDNDIDFEELTQSVGQEQIGNFEGFETVVNFMVDSTENRV